MKKEDFISWASVNNWIPIIAIIISIVINYTTYTTRTALLEQSLNDLKESNKTIISLLKDYQEDNQLLSLRVNTLETLQGIK